jgi:tetratricopeptide (TPR) repeat protein
VTRKIIGGALLVVLLGVLFQILYTRGFGMRLGAKVAPLAEPFTTEEAWIVDEIVRDITEMSAHPAAAPAVQIQETQPGSGMYRVSVGSRAPLDMDLREDLWSPASFAVLARGVFAGNAAAQPSVASLAPVYTALVELTPATLVDADTSISKVLAANMRDVAAHEAAALTVAGFALREAAGRMGDTRWALNRMTAHLAVADALRGERPAGIDGRLAEATLLALTDRQSRSMALLDKLDSEAPPRAVSAWTRALRMRITEDWRKLPTPADATRLEQREYFRARRAAIRLSRGTVELEGMGIAPDAEWVRIINSFAVGVNDGWLITDAMDMERAEYEDVFMRMHGRAIGDDPMKDLNAPAARCVSGGAVHVISWGAWAEFAQRHISVVIGRYDSFFRHSLGARDQADTQKLALKRELGDLWIFPISTIWWTKGPNGREADFRYINETVTEVLKAPHRVTAMAWTFLETGTKFEPVRRGMPAPATWYFKPARRTAYEAGVRVKDSGHPRIAADMQAILDGAPYDILLAGEYLTTKYGERPPFEEVQRLAGERLKYDLRPAGWALAGLDAGDDRRLPIFEDSCRVAASYCAGLGLELAKRGRDDEAAKAYEQAFADPSLDSVATANWSRWLARYYISHNRIGPALQLAERVARTGSYEGEAVAANVYEQLGRKEEAERMYRDGAQSYDSFSELLGFYYRAVEVHHEQQFEASWREARERMFPEGLVNSPLSTEKPARGVHIAADSPEARKTGLRAGDIIVAVDGWHVANLDQYRAIRAFPEAGAFTLTVWRGSLAEVKIADKAFVPYFGVENYPVQGWIER